MVAVPRNLPVVDEIYGFPEARFQLQAKRG